MFAHGCCCSFEGFVLVFLFIQIVNMDQLSQGYDIIQKPRPNKYLEMHEEFILTADIGSARITPEVQFVLSFSS